MRCRTYGFGKLSRYRYRQCVFAWRENHCLNQHSFLWGGWWRWSSIRSQLNSQGTRKMLITNIILKNTYLKSLPPLLKLTGLIFIQFTFSITCFDNCIFQLHPVESYKIEFAWWRHQMKPFSTLLPLCEGNAPVTGDLRRHRAHYDFTVMREKS